MFAPLHHLFREAVRRGIGSAPW
ncbi:MAG: hypothetical protein QUV07_12410 [Cyanobium sp. CZS 25K]|nr:hypothetical protein [Cyanobium sp. CZS25K]